MKNKLGLLMALAMVFAVAVACNFGSLTGSDEKSEGSDTKAEKSESASDEKSSSSESSSGEDVLNSGIPECDELAKYVNDNSEAIEGSYLGKAIVLMYKNTILKQLEESAEKMDDEQKAKMGEVCAKTMKEMKEQAEK